MRIYNPISITFQRRSLKDFKIGKYKVHKGTNWTYPFTMHHLDDQFYQNPYKLIFDRFDSSQGNVERITPGANMPFGLGKRSCIGRYFGPLTFQIVMVGLLRRFEFAEIPNTELSGFFAFGYNPSHCNLLVRTRQQL